VHLPGGLPCIRNADAAVGGGQLWRAKEILAGNLPRLGYNLELYEAYGVLLLRMGDLIEAGRFLFLSGAAEPEYDEAIRLYRDRLRKADWHVLVNSFPAAARLARLDGYPKTVQRELAQLGTPDWISANRAARPRPSRPRSLGQTTGCAIGFGLMTVLTVLVVFAVLNFIARARDFALPGLGWWLIGFAGALGYFLRDRWRERKRHEQLNSR
jgi:hypothetical protein